MQSRFGPDREGRRCRFPYLPVIVWMGMIQVVLGATHDLDAQSVNDPTIWTKKRASVIPFPTPLTVAVIG
jgi:hypothetical protein